MIDEYKGLLVSIYRSEGGDCTNGGVSSTANQAIVVGPGIPEIFSNKNHDGSELPVLRLKPVSGNTKGVRLVPVALDGKWAMMGGNFAHTSDGRFGAAIRSMIGCDFYGAVAIHDRCEG